jgi:hypothetical protein
MSNRPLPDGLPIFNSSESLAEAICCDIRYRGYAETPGTYARPDVLLFKHMNLSGETTFYDPVCGIPLFIVPRGRNISSFIEETKEHGWPSFRDAEIVNGNVLNETKNGTLTKGVKSKCGTHLGDNLPLGGHNRYCLDLSCVSGHSNKYLKHD